MSLVSDIPRLILEQGSAQAEGLRRRGALVGGTLASIGQTISTIPNEIQARKIQAQQQEMRGLELQSLKGDLAEKEKARARRAAVEQILSQYPDIEEAIPHVMRVDPAIGATLAEHVSKANKEAFEEYDRQQKFIASKLGRIHDQGSLTSNLFTLKKAFKNEDWSDIPEDYSDPATQAAITARIRSTLSPDKQAELNKPVVVPRGSTLSSPTGDVLLKGEPPAPVSVAPGSTLVDPTTSQPVFTAPESEAQKEAAKRLSDAQAETARHNRAMENAALIRARRPNATEKDKAGLVEAVIANPELFDQLTATEKGNISPKLHEQGFEGFGKPLSNAAVKQIAESKSGITSLQDLREVLKKNEQYIGPIAGLQALNPWSEARQAQANIDMVRQRVGKALEGGVLRKEDEEKYKKILATLLDTPETAIYKVDSLIKNIEQDVKNFITQQRLSGRRVSQAQEDSLKPATTGHDTVTVADVQNAATTRKSSYAEAKAWIESQGYRVVAK